MRKLNGSFGTVKIYRGYGGTKDYETRSRRGETDKIAEKDLGAIGIRSTCLMKTIEKQVKDREWSVSRSIRSSPYKYFGIEMGSSTVD